MTPKTNPLVVRDFRFAEIADSYFVARWETSLPARCRIQFSTSPSLVDTYPCEDHPQTEFCFDSRGTRLANLPASARFFVRILAEDCLGNRAASDTLELLVPQRDAIQDVRVAALSADTALVQWRSGEPVMGQVSFRAPDSTEVWSGFESHLRQSHCRIVSGLTPGMRYQVRIRQGLEREKWADQFLRSAAYQIVMPSDPGGPITTFRSDAGISLCHRAICVLADERGRLRIFFRKDGRFTTIVDDANREPAFRITLADGRRIADFSHDAHIGEPYSMTNEFGNGLRVEIRGDADLEGGVTLRRIIQIEMYDPHPDAAVFRVSYHLRGASSIDIQAADSLAFRLDRRLALERPALAEAWHLAAYQPVAESENFGMTYTVMRLRPGMVRQNALGGEEAPNQCGVPLFDYWCPETGVAIGHLNASPLPVSFPVQVDCDGVAIAMRDARPVEITPDKPWQGPPLLVVAHTLDFFDAVSRFREMMASRGIRMADPPDAAYETCWSTWGYRTEFTKNDIRQAMPILKELGVRWIQFDDPWYINHGDMDVNRKIFPGGNEDMAGFIRELNAEGFRVRLWACTGHATSNAPYARDHADRLIQDRNGHPVQVPAAGTPPNVKEYELCAGVEENRAFLLASIERMFTRLGAQAIYQDGIYGCPPCHAVAHDHDDPCQSSSERAELYRQAYQRIMELTDHQGVVMFCSCGKAPDFYLLPYINRLATADPMPVHVRQRVKSHKALLGPRGAVDYDFVELSLNDFASAIGTGGALYLKFTAPLVEPQLAHYRKWLTLAGEHVLARGEYLNLYDLAHDFPEAHAVRKGQRIYYAFYASQWAGDFETPFQGTLQVRGLDPDKIYRLWDYVNGRVVGQVAGPVGEIRASFTGSLLFYAEPV